MILKQGHKYRAMPHDGKVIRSIYRGGRCYYKDSPYSLAATQALRAAFPQYWKAIRDYGFAHPALVPFVNEDPMLIVSLVEVGKVRWLYPDTVGNYFNSGFNAKVAPTCEVLMMAINNNDTDYWGNSSIDKACYYANFQTALQYYRYGSSTSINTGVALPIGEAHLWSVGKEIKLDGELRYTTSNTYTPNELQTPIYIFRSGRGNPNKFKLAMFRIYDGEDLKHHFLPFKRNGDMELLDIVTLTLATRVGTFTEIIEDKP